MSLKWQQWKYKLTHGVLSIENVVLLVAVILCLVWTYQSIVSMTRNWTLAERLNSEQKSLELLEIEVEKAELENEYYKTNEYQELAARKLANKELAGEKMVYLPPNSEAAKNKHKVVSAKPEKVETEYSNFDLWMKYLFP